MQQNLWESDGLMKLTKNDKAILDSYCKMIDGLSNYLGSAYEIILHSIEDYHESVIYIKNGYHSGRSIGAPITDLALNMLKEIESNGLASVGFYTSYYTRNFAGERLKSSTIPIMGDNDRIIGILCINLNLNSPFSEIIANLFSEDNGQAQSETFASDVDDLISDTVMEAKNEVIYNPDIAAVNKNRALIEILYNNGIFNIKNAVPSVAKILGLSKNTVYLHLRRIKEKEATGQ